MYRYLLFVLLSVSFQKSFSQVKRQYGNHFNSWLVYSGDHKISSRWGVHLETQWRRSDFVSDPQQLLIRTGLNYHISKEVFASVGYAFVETYPYGEFPSAVTYPEHRIWEQIQLKSQLGKMEWSSRFRLEQRYSQLPVKVNEISRVGPAVYTNRIRLFNRFTLPFKGRIVEDHSVYASLYNEIFVNFGKNVGYNIFDQNRIFLGVGYKLPKAGRLEVGYLNQLVMKGDGIKIENNHTFQIALYSTLDFYKARNN